MIVCSCNVFRDHQVRSVVAKESRPRMSEVYAGLGCSAHVRPLRSHYQADHGRKARLRSRERKHALGRVLIHRERG